MREALAFGGEAGVCLTIDDGAALAWVREFFGPALGATSNGAELPTVSANSAPEAYVEASASRPEDTPERAYFAFDQFMLSLPSWRADGRGLEADHEPRGSVLGGDDERGCVLRVGAAGTELIGETGIRRWRHTLVWTIQEQIATRLRRSQLELHAATVEAGGRAIVLAGPKRAGKTTLSFHLMRSGLVRWLANDRAFLAAGESGARARGVPSATRIRAGTEAEFPELRAGLPPFGRLYLYNSAELADPDPAWPTEPPELVLNPEQIARLLGVERTDEAPIGSIILPEIDPGLEGWAVEPISAEEASAGIWANLFGDAARGREPTVFEELDGGRSAPDRKLADRIAGEVPGYRIRLGRGAYDDPDFAAGFLDAVGSGE